MRKQTYKSVTSRRNNHKKYRKTRRRKGGSRKCARRRRSNRVKRGGAVPPDLNDSWFLLYADDKSGGWHGGRTRDTWFGIGYTGNVFGPPTDPNNPNQTMIMGKAVDQGTRITLNNVLYDGRTRDDAYGYKYIEVKDDPRKFYVSPDNIIKSSASGNQEEFRPMKKWPASQNLILEGSGKVFGADWFAPIKRGIAQGRKLY